MPFINKSSFVAAAIHVSKTLVAHHFIESHGSTLHGLCTPRLLLARQPLSSGPFGRKLRNSSKFLYSKRLAAKLNSSAGMHLIEASHPSFATDRTPGKCCFNTPRTAGATIAVKPRLDFKAVEECRHSVSLEGVDVDKRCMDDAYGIGSRSIRMEVR